MNEDIMEINETPEFVGEDVIIDGAAVMAAASNSTATSTHDKTGSVRYYATADTHGYPWGRRGTTAEGYTIDFDLGDNTAGYAGTDTTAEWPVVLIDPVEEMNAKIALLGNHDTSVLAARGQLAGHDKFKLQIYKDTANKIAVYGLDTCTDNVNVYAIPVQELVDLATDLEKLGAGWDVIILSHAPLFNGHSDYKLLWPEKYQAPENAKYLYQILRGFVWHERNVKVTFPEYGSAKSFDFSGSNGHIIGCFCGHVHGHFKTKIKLTDFENAGATVAWIPVEVFSTNGSSEWDQYGETKNQGMYIPYEPYINVNYDYKTINGTSFVSPKEEFINPNTREKVVFGGGRHDTAAKCFYLTHATGAFQLQSNYYPKFYDGRYIGWTQSKRQGGAFNTNGDTGRCWYLDNSIRLSVKNLSTGATSTITAQSVWFDTNGQLRYAASSKTTNPGSYLEIVNYKTISITLQSGGVSWKFVKGLLDSIIPPYKSGVLQGKNGWAFYFDSQGKPYGMAQNGGTPIDYGAGENWMNVHEVRLFNEITTPLTNVPQIGATGTFSTGVDMARETMSGTNQISSTKGMLMRVLGGSDGKTVYWLYEGRLTSLTDATTHYPER